MSDAPDLDEWLEGEDPDWDSEPVPAESLDQADRWLRRIARFDRETAEIWEMADRQRQQISQWETARLAPIRTRRAWLATSVEGLARDLYRRNPRVASYSLPNGQLRSRKKQPEFEYTDEAGFVAWAEANRPDLLHDPVTVVKPDKVAVKLAFKGQTKFAGEGITLHVDGEIVPGVTVHVPTPDDRKYDFVAGVPDPDEESDDASSPD